MLDFIQLFAREQQRLCPPTAYDTSTGTSRELVIYEPPSQITATEGFSAIHISSTNELTCNAPNVSVLSTNLIQYLSSTPCPKPVVSAFLNSPDDSLATELISISLPLLFLCYPSQSIPPPNLLTTTASYDICVHTSLNEATTPDSFDFRDCYQDEDLKARLFSLLKKAGPKFSEIKSFLDENHNQPDSFIYNSLHDLVHAPSYTHHANVTPSPTDGRSVFRAKEALSLLWRTHKHLKRRNLLDVGCSEGSITGALGHILELRENEVHGCDVRDVGLSTGFVFTLMTDPDKLPYNDNEFSVVTLSMILHHVEHPNTLLGEVFRVLKPGGVVIVREHDMYRSELKTLFDLQHGLYDLVWSCPQEDPFFLSHFKSFYRSKMEWKSIIEGIGLRFITCDGQKLSKKQSDHVRRGYTTPFNTFCACSMMFEKPGRVPLREDLRESDRYHHRNDHEERYRRRGNDGYHCKRRR
ncbi:hypothetical protein P9112_008319 [Eukaryota sp. TZLM1-RC]